MCNFLRSSVHHKITLIISIRTEPNGARGGVVVKALRYKPSGRGFDSRRCHWNFFSDIILPAHYGLGVDSTSNRNEDQVYFLEIKVAGA